MGYGYSRTRSGGPRSWNELKRIMDVPIKPKRSVETGIDTVDEVFGGGLPVGTTIFYGPSGSGKSEFAGRLAMWFDNVAYIFSESTDDITRFINEKNVHTFDYTSYTPMWKIAVQELWTIIENLEPDLVIIDSVTDFLGVNKAMMAETDLRNGMKSIHRSAKDIPIIAISEVRGTGFSQSTAGGEGVKHNSTMVVEFGHEFMDFANKAEAFGAGIGEELYYIRVEKRKGGGAKTGRYRVILQGDDEIVLEKITPGRVRNYEERRW